MFLVAATLLSWWLGTDHGLGSRTAASMVVLTVAVAKVRLVGLYFMDLRMAPAALRLAFEGYCLALFCLLAGLFLLG